MWSEDMSLLQASQAMGAAIAMATETETESNRRSLGRFASNSAIPYIFLVAMISKR